MERLERIKKETEFNHFHYPETGKFALAFNLKQDDFDWLIEQVEKLKRCESLLSEAQDVLDDVHCYETEVFQEITRYFEGD